MSALILVVDDEPDVAELFRQQFRRSCAPRASPWRSRSRRPKPSNGSARRRARASILILSDIDMPGMSGLELLPHARQARPNVPVIMITAYGDQETRPKAIEGGAAGLFTKPIDFPVLRSEIGRRLDEATAASDDGEILVVDDEPDLEDLIRQRFRREIKDGAIAFGFARDGVAALAFLAENRDFDMVVSDINMPRMDRADPARQIAG